MLDLLQMNQKELEEYIIQQGEKRFRAKQIYEWLHVKLCTEWDEMTNISKDMKDKLKQNCSIAPLKILEKRESKIDDTSKYLFELKDGNVIESVCMHYHHGMSVCISSQVGCKMGCTFCASTLGGLVQIGRAHV